MSENKALDSALAEAFSHLRDVSVRDGVQSWDGNKWPISDIVNTVKEIDGLAIEVSKLAPGAKLPPVEVWGGGQVAQPAMFLKEDPLVNLDRIREAAPHLDLQCLYRGRQCFGFIPVSPEVQEAAMEAAIKHGVKVFRIFDMMNDPDNVDTGIAILKRHQAKTPDAGIVIEGAISYISEPESGKRAWTLDEYANYAVKLARKGCDEIAIKNYAGVGDPEMVPLIRAIKQKLEAAGFDIPVNLHSHGKKSELLGDAIEAGAGKVDVAIGALSDGPSHTNMRDVVNRLLAGKGFAQEEIDAHPVMQQLARAEAVIAQVVERKDLGIDGTKLMQEGEPKSFDEIRGPLKAITPEQVEHYRMAGGAFSSLLGPLQKEFAANDRSWKKMGPKAVNPPQNVEELFTRILERATVLWQKAGRFNTVTPGAKILTDQARILTFKEIFGNPLTMKDYTAEYINVATGRFGINQGMEKGMGDVQWRDALLMYKALEVFNQALGSKEVTLDDRTHITFHTGFGKPGTRLQTSPDGKFATEEPSLEKVLCMENDDVKTKTGMTTIERFKKAVADSAMPDSVKQSMLRELTPGRAPAPATGMEEGTRIVEALQGQGIDAKALKAEGKPISDAEDMALLAMLFRNRDANGKPDDSLLRKLLAYHAGVALAEPLAKPAGQARA